MVRGAVDGRRRHPRPELAIDHAFDPVQPAAGRQPIETFVVGGERRSADHYICALPFERLDSAGLEAPNFEHSPITGVHLWFDREITTLPHATLLDRTMQWMFNKDSGKYLQLVVSASRDRERCVE